MGTLDITAMDNLLTAIENDTLSARGKQQIKEYFQDLKMLWAEKNLPIGSIFTNFTNGNGGSDTYYYIVGIADCEVTFISYIFHKGFNFSVHCNTETLDYFISGIHNNFLIPSSLETLTTEFSCCPFKMIENVAAITQRAETEMYVAEKEDKKEI